MTLSEKQRKFTQMIANLINYAYLQGYELTFGDANRDPRVFGKRGESKGYGNKNSLHKLRLAVDFNLFLQGHFLQNTSDHEFLGLFWEEMGGTWGGRFDDGNHYSLEHKGTK